MAQIENGGSSTSVHALVRWFMTDEEWQKERIRRRDEMLKIRWAEIEMLKTRSSFWHGKWAIVCHENNVLRKKLQDIQEQIKKST